MWTFLIYPTRHLIEHILKIANTIAARGVWPIRQRKFQEFGRVLFYCCESITTQDTMNQIQNFSEIFFQFLKYLFI